MNSLRTGLTAKTLVLPNENAEEVQARADAWHQSCRPQGHLEEELVGQMALASQRMHRIARAEGAILAEQVAGAQADWKRIQEIRLLRLTRRLYSEPEKTRLDLLSFGAGVRWLLERWVNLHEVFERYGFWNHPHLVDHALRLDGINPDYFSVSTARGYELAAVAISCVPNHQEVPMLAKMLRARPPGWIGQDGVETTYDAEDARKRLRAHIELRVRELTELAEDFQRRDKEALTLASEHAQALRDTPQNRLLVRYMKSAETSFDKAYRALQKAQAERQDAAERARKPGEVEGSKPVLPNEPELVGETRSKRIHVGTCIKLKGIKYEVVQTSDGNILLCPWVDMVAESVSEAVPTPSEVVPAPETVV
jgi:hypothetical protein